MWSTKKLSPSHAMAPKPKSLLADKQPPNTISLQASTTTTSCSTAWLGPTLHVKGDISGSDDLLIDGSVEGTIQLDERRLTVGSAANLKADINARDVVVSGQVKGNVCATRRIEVKKGASVAGNLTTPEIMIEQGANFKGSIEIDSSEATKKPDQDQDPASFSPSSTGLTTSHSSEGAWTN